ncbi:MAG: PIN domain-containing protein [Chitinophagaceae bacterium]|nr:PIN domain-containing protein [Chitinophagaceae bacterium]
MEKILIDTDVILDFLFDRKPFSNEASQILGLCERKKIHGLVTPVMISNVYYILRKTASHEKIIQHLKMLMNFLDIAVIDKKVILEALNSGFQDFEDALQNFSAVVGKEIGIIITRNVRDYKTTSLPVMTPELYLKAIL